MLAMKSENVNLINTIGASPVKQGQNYGRMVANHRSQDELENIRNEDNYNGDSLNIMNSQTGIIAAVSTGTQPHLGQQRHSVNSNPATGRGKLFSQEHYVTKQGQSKSICSSQLGAHGVIKQTATTA